VSADRVEVLKRVQMLARLGTKYFQDLLSLEPGDKWERELYRQIDRSDLFLLFWSTAVRESTWVRKELQYALQRKGADELADVHFNDELLYVIAGTRTTADAG
jgi:TIR domain-containing protein